MRLEEWIALSSAITWMEAFDDSSYLKFSFLSKSLKQYLQWVPCKFCKEDFAAKFSSKFWWTKLTNIIISISNLVKIKCKFWKEEFCWKILIKKFVIIRTSLLCMYMAWFLIFKHQCLFNTYINSFQFVATGIAYGFSLSPPL